MTTGKIIALAIWTFVSKVMSLLFNTLSRFVTAFLPRSKHLSISWLQSRHSSDSSGIGLTFGPVGCQGQGCHFTGDEAEWLLPGSDEDPHRCGSLVGEPLLDPAGLLPRRRRLQPALRVRHFCREHAQLFRWICIGLLCTGELWAQPLPGRQSLLPSPLPPPPRFQPPPTQLTMSQGGVIHLPNNSTRVLSTDSGPALVPEAGIYELGQTRSYSQGNSLISKGEGNIYFHIIHRPSGSTREGSWGWLGVFQEEVTFWSLRVNSN